MLAAVPLMAPSWHCLLEQVIIACVKDASNDTSDDMFALSATLSAGISLQISPVGIHLWDVKTCPMMCWNHNPAAAARIPTALAHWTPPLELPFP